MLKLFDKLAARLRLVLEVQTDDPNVMMLMIEETTGDMVIFARGNAAAVIRAMVGAPSTEAGLRQSIDTQTKSKNN